MERDDPYQKVMRATHRGERIRQLILERLITDGPQDAEGLLPAIPPEYGADLPELRFQLARLDSEGLARGEPGGTYRLP